MSSITRRTASVFALAALLACAADASANNFIVNNSTDPGPANGTGSCTTGGTCSLRQAVNAANANSGLDNITFTVSTVHITNVGNTDPFGAKSTGPVVIDGGSGVTILGDSGANIVQFANFTAGAISQTLKNVTVDGQGTFTSSNGGPGVFVTASSGAGAINLTLDHVTIKRVTSTGGGAGFEATGAGPTVTIVDSTITGNTAQPGSMGGGGILVSDGTLNLVRSTVSGNAANSSVGGGIEMVFGSQSPTLNVVNSTISGNTASDGAAIDDHGGQVKISFSTIVGNTATGGGTASAFSTSGFTSNRLKGNIFNNSGAPKECSNVQTAVDGFNFIRDATCQSSTANSNHPSTAVAVAALANNGGPTQTMALSSGSAAINAVPTGNCTDLAAAAVALDQRSTVRPQDGACDAGAFEFVPPPVNSILPAISGTAAVGQTLTCDPGTWSGGPTFAYEWRRDGTPIGGATGTTYNVAAADAGHTLVCHVVATNTSGSTAADSAGLAIPAGSGDGGGGGGGGDGGGGGGSSDTTPPVETAYALANRLFRAAATGASVAATTRKPPIGTRVKITLSEAATVTFTVRRALPGRRSGKGCQAPSHKNRHGRRCTRLVTKGSFTFAGQAGANAFEFTGRLNGSKLPPGSYRLVARAADAAGNASSRLSRSFRIVR